LLARERSTESNGFDKLKMRFLLMDQDDVGDVRLEWLETMMGLLASG
jgi:hypothetical protein